MEHDFKRGERGTDYSPAPRVEIATVDASRRELTCCSHSLLGSPASVRQASGVAVSFDSPCGGVPKQGARGFSVIPAFTARDKRQARELSG
jgi:hypothetical protein